MPVEADTTFQAITVGGQGAWAVGKDGSCYFRHGISREAPQGQSWLQMDPPTGTKLRAVSAGSHNLWALDTSDR